MHVLVLGATGFVGRALALGLLGAGHTVTALVRSPERARRSLPAELAITDFTNDRELHAAVASADAIVNLAGESIAGGRWTAKRKRLLRDSRIPVTERLVSAIAKRSTILPVLVSASAIGYYGDRGEAELDDDSLPGTGFAAELCREWEAAAMAAKASRVVITRFGIVLGRGGGALGPLAKLARLGLGGPIGGGQQWLSWIHLDDVIGAMLHAIDSDLAGTIAVTAPLPVRQGDLARTLGKVLRRPELPAPAFAVKLALGEAASMVLGSQRVVPRALVLDGFRHRFRKLDAALADILVDQTEVVPAKALPDSAYLRARRPRYTLHTTTELDAPIDEVFEFFSSPANLAALTPPDLAFEIANPIDHVETNTVIDYKIKVAGIPLTWRTRIEQWRPGAGFVDAQERGPYRSWWHEHRFVERGGKTIMEDTVHYAPPLGPLGAVANKLFVGGMLRKIFGYRAAAIRLRFATRPKLSARARA